MKDKISTDDLKINGLSLPKSMVNRIKNGLWKAPKDKSILEKIVLAYCSSSEQKALMKTMIPDLSLFSTTLMDTESNNLQYWLLDPELKELKIMFLGKKDPQVSPGYIIPNKTILFADFGRGSDTCFALDYRKNSTNPSVILLYWGKKPEEDNRWRKIANSFEEFDELIW